MAYETKVILTMLSQQVALCDTKEEIYNLITEAASIEGLKLPSYEERMASIKKEQS